LVSVGETHVPQSTLQVDPLAQSLSEVHLVDAPPDLVKVLLVEPPHAKSIIDNVDNVAVILMKFFIT